RSAPSRTVAWLRQFAKLWGFALFCILIVYIFRDVALPFLFAILVAYILAPIVERFSRVRVGGRRIPRALAVLVLYPNILAGAGLSLGYFTPKLAGDFARLFREAPQLSARFNKELLPRAGAWIDTHFGPEAMAGDNVSEAEPSSRPRPPAAPSIVVEPLP